MEGSASMAPEAHSEAVNFDPNGPGMGLDLDFNNFQVDVGNFDSDAINVDSDKANFGYNNTSIEFDNFDLGGLNNNIGMNYSANSANFNFEDALKEAELLLGPQAREAFQESNMSLPVDPLPAELPNEKSEALTLAEANNTGSSTLQEPVHSNGMPAQKRKKMDEVDKSDILPEGSRRNRNKTARARGLDSLA
jgi:hypothetical protein